MKRPCGHDYEKGRNYCHPCKILRDRAARARIRAELDGKVSPVFRDLAMKVWRHG